MTFEFPRAVLEQHSAFLGKTGSGKTSTAKKAIEQIVRATPAARVCVLDPIKSDWWGLTSSADGRRPGLPFYILGGPRGHVPLHDSAGKAIGELVATGDLPLSIIDMADFGAGGLQKFFNDFAPALMKRMRGVVYLVIEEAHEFAPKERAGIGAESLAIHNAKKLATAGRSKGIRMMVLTQRTQALHNALLGSCDTMIAHRLTAPADQEPVKKWLKANVDKATYERVSTSLASLKTGTGWICSGEAQVAELVQFPKIATFDNSATPTGDMADQHVQTAPVDQARLRTIIGDAVKQAEEDDPKRLRAEIARLTALTKVPQNIPQNIPDQAAILDAERRGWQGGYTGGFRSAERQATDAFEVLKEQVRATVRNFAKSIDDLVSGEKLDLKLSHEFSTTPTAVPPARLPPVNAGPSVAPPQRQGSNSGSEQKIVDAIMWWNVLGVPAPSHAQVGFVAGYSHKSGTWATYLSRLRSAGMIEGRGDLILTDAGRAAANRPPAPPNGHTLRSVVLSRVDPPLARILEPIIEAYPRGLTHEQAGAAAGYSHSSGTWATYLSRLRSLDVIEGRGELKAQGWLFP